MADPIQEQLDQLDSDFHISIRVLAVVLETLFHKMGCNTLTVTEPQLIDSPDLIARVDPRTRAVTLTLER